MVGSPHERMTSCVQLESNYVILFKSFILFQIFNLQNSDNKIKI